MSIIEDQKPDDTSQDRPGCGVNDTFNFVVGAVALLATLLISYVVYRLWL